MSRSPPNYGNVLNAVAEQKGCTLEYTVPALVSGGICPPPSRVYPGTVCYMITVKVDRTEYHGFGPTPIIARHYAEVEAYNALVKAPSIEDAKNTSPNKVQVFASEGNATTTGSAVVEDRAIRNQQASTTGSSGNDERHISGNGSLHLGYVDASDGLAENVTHNKSDGDPYRGGGSSKALQYKEDNSTTYSHKVAGTVTAPGFGKVGDTFCEIPLPKSRYHVPEDHDEMVKMFVKSSENEVDGNNPSAFTFRRRNQRDITDVLYEVARQKGVKVIIEVGSCGPPRLRQVLVKVRGGGMQFEGRHAKQKVAKAIAAQKFLDALQKFHKASWEMEPTLSPDRDHRPQHQNTATSSNTHPQSSSLQSPQSPAGLKPARDAAKCSLGMPSPMPIRDMPSIIPSPMPIRDMPSIIPPHAATDCTLSHVTSTSRDLSTTIQTVNSSLSTNGNSSRVPRQHFCEQMPPVYSNAPFNPTAMQVNPPPFNPTAMQVNPPPFNPTAMQVNPPPFNPTAMQVNPPPFNPTAIQVNTPPFNPTAMQVNPPPFNPTAIQVNTPPFGPTAVQVNPPPFSPTAMQVNPPPFNPTAMQVNTPPFGPTAVQVNPPPFSPTAMQVNPPPFNPTAMQVNPPPFGPTAMQVNPQQMLSHGGDRQGQQYPQQLMYHTQPAYVHQYASFSNIPQMPQATNLSYSVPGDNVEEKHTPQWDFSPNPQNTPNVPPLKEKHTPQWDHYPNPQNIPNVPPLKGKHTPQWDSPNPHNTPNVPPLKGSIQEVNRDSIRASREVTATEGASGEKQKRKTTPYREYKYTYSQTYDSVDQLSSSKHDSDARYPGNPVGQLQELLVKELNILPVFAERIQSAGKFKRYTCVVSAKGLSAEGIASSKKLARRHAAENLLVVMEEEGMNFNPDLLEMRTKDTHLKKSKRSKTARENPTKTNSPTKASSTSPSPQLQREAPTVYAQPSVGTQWQPQPQTSPPMESQVQVGPQPLMRQPQPVPQFVSQGPQDQRVGPYPQFVPPGPQVGPHQRVGPYPQFVPPGPQVGPDQRVGPYPQFVPPGPQVGPDQRVGPYPQFGPSGPQVGPDQRVGPYPQFVPSGPQVGPEQRVGPYPQFGPSGPQVGPDQRVGPYPQFGPSGPQVGPEQRVGPRPQSVPPGQQVGPDQQVGPYPQFGPSGPQVGPEQRVGPYPQFGPSGPQVGPDQRVGPRPQFVPPGPQVGPDRRVGPRPQFVSPGTQVGPDRRVGPRPQFVSPGTQVGPDQRVGPYSQLGPPGTQAGADRVGPYPQFVSPGPQVWSRPQFEPPGAREGPHPQFGPMRTQPQLGPHPQMFPQLLQHPYFSPYYRPPNPPTHPQTKSGLLPTPSPAVTPRQGPGVPLTFLPTPYRARQGLTIPTPYTSMTYHGPPMPYGPPIGDLYSSPRQPGPAPPTLGSNQPPIYPHPLKTPSVTTTESESETEDVISLGLCEIVPDQTLKTPTSDVSQRDSDSSKATPGGKLQPTSNSAVYQQRDSDSSKAAPGRELQPTLGVCSTTGHNPSPNEIPGRSYEKSTLPSYKTIEPPSSKREGDIANESFPVLGSSPNKLTSLSATRDQLQTDTSGEPSETTRKTRETTRKIPSPPSTSKGKWVPLSRPYDWPVTSHNSPSTDPLYFTERLPREREEEWTGGKVKTTRHKILPPSVKSHCCEETPGSQSDAILSVQKTAYTAVSDHERLMTHGNEHELPVHPLMKMTHDNPSSSAGRPSHLSTPLRGMMRHLEKQLAGYLIGSGENICVGLPTEGSVEDTI